MTAVDLYTPDDVMEAHLSWSATCGPAALAAVLQIPVCATRPLLRNYKGWTTPTQMRSAIEAFGARAVPTPDHEHKIGLQLPAYGVAFLQWAGGWWDGKREKLQYKFTHWVGAFARDLDDVLIYDVNAGEHGGWIPKIEWLDTLYEQFKAKLKCTNCYVRQAFEVEL